MSPDENAAEESMSQAVETTESVEQTEARLWAEYMIALVNVQLCWRLRHESWHKFVLTGLRGDVARQVHYQTEDMHDAASKAENVAYAAWQAVAYPLHNISMSTPKKKSS